MGSLTLAVAAPFFGFPDPADPHGIAHLRFEQQVYQRNLGYAQNLKRSGEKYVPLLDFDTGEVADSVHVDIYLSNTTQALREINEKLEQRIKKEERIPDTLGRIENLAKGVSLPAGGFGVLLSLGSWLYEKRRKNNGR